MAQSGSVALSRVGIVFAVGGLVLMLLTLLDYLQDGQSSALIVVVEVLLIITGALMYMGGRKSKTQDE